MTTDRWERADAMDMYADRSAHMRAQIEALKAEVAYLRAMRVWTKNYESMMRLYNVGAANPTAWRAANPQPVRPEGVEP